MRCSSSSSGRPFRVVGGRVDTAILPVIMLVQARICDDDGRSIRAEHDPTIGVVAIEHIH